MHLVVLDENGLKDKVITTTEQLEGSLQNISLRDIFLPSLLLQILVSNELEMGTFLFFIGVPLNLPKVHDHKKSVF